MTEKTAQPGGTWWAPLPLIVAGLLPLAAGALLAPVSGFPWRGGVFATGAMAVTALIIAAFAAREIYAPGAGRYPAWRLTPLPGTRLTDGKGNPNRIMFYIWLGLAAAWALDLQFYYGTGDLTIPLGGLGVLGGYFSFAPPLSWHRRGLGEAAGGLCFGLLPVTAGLYLQCGHLVTEVLVFGVPLSLAAFNLFLVYGWPLPDETGTPGGGSLARRLRPVSAALLYTVINILTMGGLLVCLFFPANPLPLRAALWPVLALCVVNQELVKRRAYLEERRLRLLCRLTLATHLAMGLAFTLIIDARL